MRRAPFLFESGLVWLRQVQRHERGDTRAVRLTVDDNGGRLGTCEAECLGQKSLVTGRTYARPGEEELGVSVARPDA